jgi:hypothetical protein
MLAHIDQLTGFFYPLKCPLDDSFWVTYESHNGPIRCLPWVHVKQRDAVNGCYGIRNLSNNI